jgi:hypothetical protein
VFFLKMTIVLYSSLLLLISVFSYLMIVLLIHYQTALLNLTLFLLYNIQKMKNLSNFLV